MKGCSYLGCGHSTEAVRHRVEETADHRARGCERMVATAVGQRRVGSNTSRVCSGAIGRWRTRAPVQERGISCRSWSAMQSPAVAWLPDHSRGLQGEVSAGSADVLPLAFLRVLVLVPRLPCFGCGSAAGTGWMGDEMWKRPCAPHARSVPHTRARCTRVCEWYRTLPLKTGQSSVRCGPSQASQQSFVPPAAAAVPFVPPAAAPPAAALPFSLLLSLPPDAGRTCLTLSFFFEVIIKHPMVCRLGHLATRGTAGRGPRSRHGIAQWGYRATTRRRCAWHAPGKLEVGQRHRNAPPLHGGGNDPVFQDLSRILGL